MFCSMEWLEPSSVGKQQHHMKENMGNSKGNLGLHKDYTSGLC